MSPSISWFLILFHWSTIYPYILSLTIHSLGHCSYIALILHRATPLTLFLYNFSYYRAYIFHINFRINLILSCHWGSYWSLLAAEGLCFGEQKGHSQAELLISSKWWKEISSLLEQRVFPGRGDDIVGITPACVEWGVTLWDGGFLWQNPPLLWPPTPTLHCFWVKEWSLRLDRKRCGDFFDVSIVLATVSSYLIKKLI